MTAIIANVIWLRQSDQKANAFIAWSSIRHTGLLVTATISNSN